MKNYLPNKSLIGLISTSGGLTEWHARNYYNNDIASIKDSFRNGGRFLSYYLKTFIATLTQLSKESKRNGRRRWMSPRLR